LHKYHVWVFWWCWDLNSGPSTWATPPSLFLWRGFEIGSWRTICLGWLWTLILLILSSWDYRCEPLMPGIS
jgi:hypothetical protein